MAHQETNGAYVLLHIDYIPFEDTL